MNRKTVYLLAGVVVAAGAVSAIAAVAERGAGGERGGWGLGAWHHHHHADHRRGDSVSRLLRLDADRDGDVTLQEFLKPREERFAALDANKDGTLDAPELTAHFKAKTIDRIDRMLRRLDADGDGKISREEFALAAAHPLSEGGPRGHHGRHHGRGGHQGWGGPPDDITEDRADDTEQPAAKAPAKQAEAAPPTSPETAPAPGGERHGWRHHGGKHWGESGDARRAAFVTGIEQRFKALDRNGDGYIDKPELEAAQADEIAYRVKRMMHDLDRDKDGKISREEFLARSKERFARLDLNDDGKIDADDMPPSAKSEWTPR